jgi:tetratricopeptide (TPR) repeat protein
MAFVPPAVALAEDPPAAASQSVSVKWGGTDVRGGGQLSVPAEDRKLATIMLFLRVDQLQSSEAVAQVKEILATGDGAKSTQVITVFSGESGKDSARKLAADPKWTWPLVVDPDHAVSGQMGVHAWPTTLVIGHDGKQLCHLAGYGDAYTRTIGGYLELAAGKVDEAALKAELEGNHVVVDSPAQMASRHLKVAQRLLERGLVDQAKVELAEVVKHAPADLAGRLSLADALLIVGQPKEAMQILDGSAAGAAPSWQADVLRGRALVALEKWDEAREVLSGAVKRATAPAEAWYELGKVYQHQGDAGKAASAYRAAFEATGEGKRLNPQGDARAEK